MVPKVEELVRDVKSFFTENVGKNVEELNITSTCPEILIELKKRLGNEKFAGRYSYICSRLRGNRDIDEKIKYALQINLDADY